MKRGYKPGELWAQTQRDVKRKPLARWLSAITRATTPTSEPTLWALRDSYDRLMGVFK